MSRITFLFAGLVLLCAMPILGTLNHAADRQGGVQVSRLTAMPVDPSPEEAPARHYLR